MRNDFWHVPFTGAERQRVQDGFNDTTGRLTRERVACEAQAKDAGRRRAIAAVAEKGLRDAFAAQPDVLPVALMAVDYAAIADVVATLIDQQAARS